MNILKCFLLTCVLQPIFFSITSNFIVTLKHLDLIFHHVKFKTSLLKIFINNSVQNLIYYTFYIIYPLFIVSTENMKCKEIEYSLLNNPVKISGRQMSFFFFSLRNLYVYSKNRLKTCFKILSYLLLLFTIITFLAN